MTDIGFQSVIALELEGLRIACHVRLKHLKKLDQTDDETDEVHRRLKDFEKYIDDNLILKVAEHPSAYWWGQIQGLQGRLLSRQIMGKIIGEIENFGKYYAVGDPMILRYVQREPDKAPNGSRWISVTGIERLTTVSKLWKYAGFATVMKRLVGKLSEFNVGLKTYVWRLMTYSHMMHKNRYYEFFLEYKDRKIIELQHRGFKIIPTPKEKHMLTCSKYFAVKAAKFCPRCNSELANKTESEGVIFLGHLDAMARRWGNKLFLTHFYVTWSD